MTTAVSALARNGAADSAKAMRKAGAAASSRAGLLSMAMSPCPMSFGYSAPPERRHDTKSHVCVRPPGGGDRLRHDQLDAAIERAPVFGRIRTDRREIADAGGVEPVAGNPVRAGERRGHRLGALARQRHVVLVGALAVGVADNEDAHLRLAAEQLGHLGERRRAFLLQS